MCFFDVVLRVYGVKLHDKLAIGWALVVFSDGFGNFLFFACCLVLYLRFWQFFMFWGFVCDFLPHA